VTGADVNVFVGLSAGVCVWTAVPFTTWRRTRVAASLTLPATVCAAWLVRRPSAGALSVTTGATVSIVAWTCAGWERLPAVSVTAASVWAPSGSTTVGVQVALAAAGVQLAASAAPSAVSCSVAGSTPAPRSL
jgi:hypothetical protein